MCKKKNAINSRLREKQITDWVNRHSYPNGEGAYFVDSVVLDVYLSRQTSDALPARPRVFTVTPALTRADILILDESEFKHFAEGVLCRMLPNGQREFVVLEGGEASSRSTQDPCGPLGSEKSSSGSRRPDFKSAVEEGFRHLASQAGDNSRLNPAWAVPEAMAQGLSRFGTQSLGKTKAFSRLDRASLLIHTPEPSSAEVLRRRNAERSTTPTHIGNTASGRKDRG